METRLKWKQIEKDYNQQWVELVDYDWPDEEPYPRSGILRTHGSEKKEFYRQCRREPMPNDSAIIYVGPPRLPQGVVLSPSLIRVG